MERNGELSTEDRLVNQLLKSQIFLLKGEYEKSLELAKAIHMKVKNHNKPLLTVDTHIAIAWAMGKLERYSESLEEITKAEKQLSGLLGEPSTEIQLKQANLFHLRGRNLNLKMDPMHALDPLERGLALYEQYTNKYGKAFCLCDIGRVYFERGDKTRALEYYQQSLVLYAELGNKLGMAECLKNIGIIYQRRREFDEAIDYFQRSLGLAEELNNQSVIAQTLDGLGAVYLSTDPEKAHLIFQKAIAINEEFGYQERLAKALIQVGSTNSILGAPNRGLEYLQRGKEICEEIGYNRGIAHSFHMLGWTYQYKGELNQALKHCQESLVKFEEVGESDRYPWILFPQLTLGIIYHAMGETESAFENYNKCLTNSMEIGNGFITAYVLYHLILLTLDEKQMEKANTYLQQLKVLANQGLPSDEDQEVLWWQLDSAQQLEQISEGLILKASSRLKDKVRAHEIFQQLLEKTPIMNVDVTYSAMLSLCELQLFELQAAGDEITLETTKSLVEQLSDQAEKQGSYTYLVNSLILQAKLAMIEGDLLVANGILKRAQRIAKEEELIKLTEKVASETQLLNDQYQQWERLVQTNAPIQERLEHAKLKDYLKSAQKLARHGVINPE
jgi:tetratricopeptide (TPR) repeat protein